MRMPVPFFPLQNNHIECQYFHQVADSDHRLVIGVVDFQVKSQTRVR